MPRPQPAVAPTADIVAAPGVTIYHRFAASPPGETARVPAAHADIVIGAKHAVTLEDHQAQQKLAADKAAQAPAALPNGSDAPAPASEPAAHE